MILNQILLERAFLLALKNAPPNLGKDLSKRRCNALDKAFRNLLENPYIDYEAGKLLILSDSVTENGEAKFYETSSRECRLTEPGNFLCYAFWQGNPCWHKATFEIVGHYFEIADRDDPVFRKHPATVPIVNSSVASVNSVWRF